ncbi:hypothetical protein EK21DRAFT_106447 [Setomelanomma holmii]|uniref:Transmembrane protein n=1 Tax=Setomelanomma holmii TaxID=210430 RepID=A0A9P4LT68_9PLEO|nr:hypothetical protein EK21DRAFT_106447 [Setomelanomma holmii]
MKIVNLVVMFATMLFGDIWAVYGIALPTPGTKVVSFEEPAKIPDLASSPIPTHTTVFVTPALASQPPPSDATRLSDHITVTTSPNSTPTPTETALPPSTPFLSTPAILGISISSALLLLITLFLVCGLPYVRRKRRGRALQRAVEEVERGIEMRKTGALDVTGSKENMVLESQVEIFMHDGHGDERDSDMVDMVGRWDGWDASGDLEEEEWERGRKGMSLPRREW